MSQLELSERFKKIGEPRTETIEVTLSPQEIVEQSARANQLRNQLDAMKHEMVAFRAQFKARERALIDAERLAREEVSTGKRHLDVLVEDHLTPQSEVVFIRCDTGDIVGRRTASSEELQEELFGSDDDSGFGRPS